RVYFVPLILAVYTLIQRLRRPPAAHGRLTGGDKIVILVLFFAIWPVALLYWVHAANKADELAARKQ
ncbi:MAG: hypothetical protein QUS09_09185, partial [Methanotrichaceae archaeon]|nr:hypothetical protein [Methanotrichaceae archaeon]